jgi:hypothetical protein
MAQFTAISPDVEVNGQTVLSIVAGMDTFREIALEILESKGISSPKENDWFLQQSWLDAFKEIAENVGEYTLMEIGRQIPENADWPPQVNSIETALSSIDIAYHMNHRINGSIMFDPQNGTMLEGIGHYAFRKDSEKKITMICDNPYPSDFDKGIIESAANKFKTKGDRIRVFADSASPSRKTGADSCTYTVTW